jgi:glycerophosphoryl diester phosphodiesterase
MEAMTHSQDGITIVIAHRGAHKSETFGPLPENSLAAIDAAAKLGVEAIELDLRMTRDKKVVLSHDQSWGREASKLIYGEPARYPFDPFDKPDRPYQKHANPRVDALDLATTQKKWRLRSSDLKTVSDEPPQTLETALKHIAENKINTVVALDIKDVPVAEEAWKIVSRMKDANGQPFHQSVLFKLDASNFPTPEHFKEKFNTKLVDGEKPDWEHIKFMPIYQGRHLIDKAFNPEIADALKNKKEVTDEQRANAEKNVLKSLEAYSDPKRAPFFVMAEVNTKTHDGVLSSLMIDKNPVTGHQAGVAAFQPVQDTADPNGFPGGRYFNSKDGSCCYVLSKHFFKGEKAGLPSDKEDHRWNATALIDDFKAKVITSDAVEALVTELEQKGQRNLDALRMDTSPAYDLPSRTKDSTQAPSKVEPDKVPPPRAAGIFAAAAPAAEGAGQQQNQPPQRRQRSLSAPADPTKPQQRPGVERPKITPGHGGENTPAKSKGRSR